MLTLLLRQFPLNTAFNPNLIGCFLTTKNKSPRSPLMFEIFVLFIYSFCSLGQGGSALRPGFLLYVQYLAGCRDSNPSCCGCSQVCYL